MSREVGTTPLYELSVRRPAAALAVCFIVGVLSCRYVPVWTGAWVGTAAALAAIGVAWDWRASRGQRSADMSGAVLALAVALAGILAGQLALFGYSADHIVAYTDDGPRLARVRVEVEDPPRLVRAQHGNPRQVARATVREVLTTGGWRRASGQIVLQAANTNTPFAAGQTIEALGWLKRPEPAANPGQFDWAGYYRQQRIVARLDVTEPGCAKVIARGSPGAVWPLREKVRELLARGFAEDQAIEHALLRALLLGDNDPQLRDVQDLFVATGTSHHLAISGMHIAVLGGLVYFVCRVFRARPRLGAVIVLGFVIVYGVVALPSPPVLRSVILCVLVLGGTMLRRSVDVVQLLALSVFAMLVVEPLDLFAPGFQLSFGTVLGLIVFTPWVNRKLDLLQDEHARVAASLMRPTLARRAWNGLKGTIREALVAGVVAWAVSLPLIVFHFDRLNPYAILGSIALAPVVFIGLVGGLLKVLLTLVCPWLAPTWATLAAFGPWLMKMGVEWLAMLPGSDVPFPAPSPWMLVVAYAAMFLPLLPYRPKVPAVLRRLAPAGGLALVLAPWPVAVIQAKAPSPPCLRVTVLSVGNGNCAVVEAPDGSVALIDAGSASVQPLARNVIDPFFRTRRIRHVDDIFVTGSGTDSLNAVEDVIGTYGVHEVIVAHTFGADAGRHPAARQFVNTMRRANRGPRTVGAGDHLLLGRQVTIDVLSPPAGDGALVLRVGYGGRSVLFCGGIDASAERRLINGANSLTADVLIAPRHGTASEMTGFFVDEVNPAIVVSSNDRSLTTKQREFDRVVGARTIYRTDRCGAVTVTIGAAGQVGVETFLGK